MKAPKTPVALSDWTLNCSPWYTKYRQYFYLTSTTDSCHVSNFACNIQCKTCLWPMSFKRLQTQKIQVSSDFIVCTTIYSLDNPDSISLQIKYQLAIKVKMTSFRRRSKAVNVKKLLIFCVVLLSKSCFCMCKIFSAYFSDTYIHNSPQEPRQIIKRDPRI